VGEACESDTQGLLQRAHIVANWPPIYIGEESDRHWEEGEELSLMEFSAIEYKFVRAIKLAKCLKVLEQYELAQ